MYSRPEKSEFSSNINLAHAIGDGYLDFFCNDASGVGLEFSTITVDRGDLFGHDFGRHRVELEKIGEFWLEFYLKY
ncbi:MAG: hypothetical protein ACMUEM_07325 [Flavobacteriales bacterium AspAUS03]